MRSAKIYFSSSISPVSFRQEKFPWIGLLKLFERDKYVLCAASKSFQRREQIMQDLTRSGVTLLFIEYLGAEMCYHIVRS